MIEKLSEEDLIKRMNKAIEFYKETNLTMPDKIYLAKLKLPRININGKIIDLEKEFPNAIAIVSSIGFIPYITYIARKGEDNVLFYHDFKKKQAVLCVDPEDNSRIFIAWLEEATFDAEGVK